MAKDVTVKLKGGVEITVPAAIIDGFNDDVYDSIFMEGLKVHLSKGLAGTKAEGKITVKDTAKIEAKAKANLQNLVEGKVKASRAKVKGASGAVMVEARRLAKNAIKQEAKRQGIKVSHLDPKEITVWANQLLESEHGKALIAQATENLNKAGEESLFSGINLGIHANDSRAVKANKKAQDAADKKEKEKAKAGAFVPQKGGKPAQMHA